MGNRYGGSPASGDLRDKPTRAGRPDGAGKEAAQIRKLLYLAALSGEIKKKKKDFDLKDTFFLSSTMSQFQTERVILIMFGEGRKISLEPRKAIPYVECSCKARF